MRHVYAFMAIMSTNNAIFARYIFAISCEKPNMNDDTVGARLRLARETRDLTQPELGELWGRDKSAVSRAESGSRQIKLGDVKRLSVILDINEDWLSFGTGQMERNVPRVKPDDVFEPSPIAGSDLVNPNRGLPVYAAARGGEGHVIITFDPISYMKIPAVLQDVKGGYGILLTGDSMVPAYRPGETALVNPNLPPARDEDVVLYHTSETDENEAIIKRLIGFNDREWILEQYNPHKEFKEYRADWPICHRVVGKYNTR